MKIEKLPSGSYRIRKMYKGNTYTVIFESKPTQKEAVQAMAEKLNKVHKANQTMTFETACHKYIESKRNVLSPSTIRGYSGIMKQISDALYKKNVHDITAVDVQEEINRIAKLHTPKTVRNHHGFISAVLGMFYPDLKLTTTLPQKIKKEPYIPSSDDIKRILAYAENTQFEVPLILACYGMRRSEICALTLEDINGDIVHINKAMVQNEDKKWIIKTTKTTSSTRDIILPACIIEKIYQQGYVYKGHPNSITCFLFKAQSNLGIPKFSIHKLRHYFASEMSALGIQEADILQMGGWETDYVMKSVYRHSMIEKEENAKREAANKLHNTLFS